MRIVDIKNIDFNNCFFHYTDKNNLDNIINNGLVTKIEKDSNNYFFL